MRVLAQKLPSILSMQDLKLDLTEHPCILSLWREVPRWAGWKSLPENGFPKAPLWCQQLTRGVCDNIADILVKVRGKGPVLDPLSAGKLLKTNALNGMYGSQSQFQNFVAFQPAQAPPKVSLSIFLVIWSSQICS